MNPNGLVAAASITSQTLMSIRSHISAISLTSPMLIMRNARAETHGRTGIKGDLSRRCQRANRGANTGDREISEQGAIDRALYRDLLRPTICLQQPVGCVHQIKGSPCRGGTAQNTNEGIGKDTMSCAPILFRDFVRTLGGKGSRDDDGSPSSGRLGLVRGGRAIVSAVGRIPVVIGQPACYTDLRPARHSAAMAAIENRNDVDSLVDGLIELSGQLFVPDVESILVSVRGHDGFVQMIGLRGL